MSRLLNPTFLLPLRACAHDCLNGHCLPSCFQVCVHFVQDVAIQAQSHQLVPFLILVFFSPLCEETKHSVPVRSMDIIIVKFLLEIQNTEHEKLCTQRYARLLGIAKAGNKNKEEKFHKCKVSGEKTTPSMVEV